MEDTTVALFRGPLRRFLSADAAKDRSFVEHEPVHTENERLPPHNKPTPLPNTGGRYSLARSLEGSPEGIFTTSRRDDLPLQQTDIHARVDPRVQIIMSSDTINRTLINTTSTLTPRNPAPEYGSFEWIVQKFCKRCFWPLFFLLSSIS